jgi:hypothetical protein
MISSNSNYYVMEPGFENMSTLKPFPLEIFFFFLFESIGDCTQDLTLARQGLYHLNYTPVIFAFSLFFR